MLHGVQLISKPNITQNGLIYLARLHLGVNPSLTITALAEAAISHIPPKECL